MAEVVIDMKEALPEQERELGREVSAIEQHAASIVIQSDEDYAAASTFARNIKSAQKKVKDYWEPMRVSTYNAYKSVTDHKKQMTDPLDKAESIIKRKMSVYQMEVERKRREEEERLRRLAQEEMDRKLAEAAKAEAKGDVYGAEFAMAEAEAIDNMAATMTYQPVSQKPAGISHTKSWEIKSIDLRKLPDEFNGVALKIPDTKAIMNLIKASKGSIQIPGVEFEETISISVRAS